MMTASGATRLTALTMLGISCTSMVIEPGIQKYDFRVRLNMLRDISADERVEPACRHAQFAENFAAEIWLGS